MCSLELVHVPREIYPSFYVCDCGHELHFSERTIREMRHVSRRKRSGIGEGDDRHTAIFDGGEWVAIFCPKVNAEIPAQSAPPPLPPRRRRAKPAFTPRQGQVLAFIHAYTKLNRRPPAQADIASYFQLTAPPVHSMILTLGRLD